MHSTILLSGVALLDRLHCVKSNIALEKLWRSAILGGLITTTFQVSFKQPHWIDSTGYSLGQWIAVSQGIHDEFELEGIIHNENLNSTSVAHLPPKIEFEIPNSPLRPMDLTYAYTERFALLFTLGLTLIWIVGAIMNTFSLVWLGLQARSRLKNRKILKGSMKRDFDLIHDSSELHSLKIAVTDRIEGAVALPNGEIVFPQWIFDSLTVQHRQAIYAHELAHLIRRDPIWLLFLHLLNSILWLQPFHRTARKRLVHLAELQADAWAARKLSNPRILAETLCVCAERMSSPSSTSLGCTFSSSSALVERIDCLLDGTAMTSSRQPYVTQWAAASILAFAMFLMPGCKVDTEMAYRSGERISVTKHGDGRKGEASIRRANLFVKLSHNGRLKLTADNDDVETLEDGGQFKLTESRGSAKRIYTVTSNKLGVVSRSYLLNGKEMPIDENVQKWFANALQRTVRESGF